MTSSRYTKNRDTSPRYNKRKSSSSSRYVESRSSYNTSKYCENRYSSSRYTESRYPTSSRHRESRYSTHSKYSDFKCSTKSRFSRRRSPSSSRYYIESRYSTNSRHTKRKSLTSNKQRFNSLPPEIIKEILCVIGGRYLLDLKLVCKHWYKLITQILNIKLCDVSALVTENALNIFDSWVKRSNGRSSFFMYEASYNIRNLISKPVISTQLESYTYLLKEVTYLVVLRKLQHHAESGGAYVRGCEDVVGSVWRTVLATTGLKYSVEELREKNFEDQVVKSFMKQYTWYIYKARSMADVIWDVGIIALYPDNKRYTMIYAYDYD